VYQRRSDRERRQQDAAERALGDLVERAGAVLDVAPGTERHLQGESGDNAVCEALGDEPRARETLHPRARSRLVGGTLGFGGGAHLVSDVPIKVLIDARNVQRSQWPNLSDSELVELAGRWADEHGHEAVIVFDGRAPEGTIGTGRESADDWLAREADLLAEAGEPFWLVTSDRELRERAGLAAKKVIGGGTFVRELTSFPE
jgi:hypothetical protein